MRLENAGQCRSLKSEYDLHPSDVEPRPASARREYVRRQTSMSQQEMNTTRRRVLVAATGLVGAVGAGFVRWFPSSPR